jgi:type II secretory ATPase GspE/PulE/Tfp pilus assembly ATPase PilB-like protein
VFEVLQLGPRMRRSLLEDPTEATLATVASAHGHISLREAALAAAVEGRTTFEEVLRVTQDDTGPSADSGPA